MPTIYSCVGLLRMPPSVADMLSETPLKRTSVPSPSCCQSQTPSWQRWDYVSIFPLFCWNLVCLKLFQSCACCHIVSASSVSICPTSLKSHPPHLALTIFLCDSHSWPLKGGMWKRFPSRDEHTKVFHSLHVVQLGGLHISSFEPKAVNGTSNLTIAIWINFQSHF